MTDAIGFGLSRIYAGAVNGKEMTKTYEDGIKDAIAALPTKIRPGEIIACKQMPPTWQDGWDACAGQSCATLEALLPDPAEELVREWVEQLGSVLFDAIDECALNFARWLIDTGRIKPSEIGK